MEEDQEREERNGSVAVAVGDLLLVRKREQGWRGTRRIDYRLNVRRINVDLDVYERWCELAQGPGSYGSWACQGSGGGCSDGADSPWPGRVYWMWSYKHRRVSDYLCLYFLYKLLLFYWTLVNWNRNVMFLSLALSLNICLLKIK